MSVNGAAFGMGSFNTALGAEFGGNCKAGPAATSSVKAGNVAKLLTGGAFSIATSSIATLSDESGATGCGASSAASVKEVAASDVIASPKLRSAIRRLISSLAVAVEIRVARIKSVRA
tara:strand:- start:247 stop:600 length:354 start_codon:yes stop_codon:yes gene_type:complete